MTHPPARGPIPALAGPEAIGLHPKRRSVGYLEHECESWACFLVTYQRADARWCGRFSFRARDAAEGEEVRTADIFIEATMGEVDRKARGLGRPLLTALLASALDTRERLDDDTPQLRRWFRELLAEHSESLDGEPSETDSDDATLATLRSLYASYRLDQVAHLIALVRPTDFEETVASVLDDRSVDFSSRDRLQFAMMVVDRIERLLPLPPFEVWVEDFLEHREEYRLYAHTLHRERRLP